MSFLMLIKKIFYFGWKKLGRLTYPYRLALKDTYAGIKRIALDRIDKVKITSGRDWSEQKKINLTSVNSSISIEVSSPRFLIRQPTVAFPNGKALLPENYIIELHKATVIGGTDMVLVNKKEAIYDEIALAETGRYAFRNIVIKHLYNDEAVIHYRKGEKNLIEKGIHFCKDGAYNYFHWLLDCLPRLSLIEKIEKFATWPLLLDEGLSEQCIESLRYFVGGQKELIWLKNSHSYFVEYLAYTSDLSIIHNNYDFPISPSKDVVLSPTAVQYVRSTILNKIGINRISVFKKIYVTRKNQKFPRITNETEIISLFIDLGFYIIYPELLSFTDQVKIFSQAEIIVGASGAGLTNIIFAPENSKVLVLCLNHQQVNYYIFDMLAKYVNIKLAYLLGEKTGVQNLQPKGHAPYEVDINLIKPALFELLDL